MAETVTDKVMEAYTQAFASGVAVADAGVAQTTAAVKLMTDAVQAERAEYGKVWEQASRQVQERNESLAAVIPALMQGMATSPAAGIPAVSPEAREAASKLITSEMAFYQSWTQAWMQYFAGVEQRRSATAQAMMEAQDKVVASQQEATQSAVKYGEAVMDWTMDSLNATKS